MEKSIKTTAYTNVYHHEVYSMLHNLAYALSITDGSDYAVTDMDNCLIKWEKSDEKSFYIVVRIRGAECGTLERVKKYCKDFGTPVYIFHILREEENPFTYTLLIKSIPPLPIEKPFG